MRDTRIEGETRPSNARSHRTDRHRPNSIGEMGPGDHPVAKGCAREGRLPRTDLTQPTPEGDRPVVGHPIDAAPDVVSEIVGEEAEDGYVRTERDSDGFEEPESVVGSFAHIAAVHDGGRGASAQQTVLELPGKHLFLADAYPTSERVTHRDRARQANQRRGMASRTRRDQRAIRGKRDTPGPAGDAVFRRCRCHSVLVASPFRNEGVGGSNPLVSTI